VAALGGAPGTSVLDAVAALKGARTAADEAARDARERAEALAEAAAEAVAALGGAEGASVLDAVAALKGAHATALAAAARVAGARAEALAEEAAGAAAGAGGARRVAVAAAGGAHGAKRARSLQAAAEPGSDDEETEYKDEVTMGNVMRKTPSYFDINPRSLANDMAAASLRERGLHGLLMLHPLVPNSSAPPLTMASFNQKAVGMPRAQEWLQFTHPNQMGLGHAMLTEYVKALGGSVEKVNGRATQYRGVMWPSDDN